MLTILFQTLLALLGLTMIAATLLPLLPKDAWWIRMCDFPRLQIAALLLLVLLAYPLLFPVGLWSGLLLGAVLAALLYQIGRMLPYTRLWPKEVQDSRRPDSPVCLSLLVCNVLMDNRQAQRCLEVVRRADADLLLFVETDHWWRDQLAELENTHPHTVLEPIDNTYGMLLYSRLPFAEMNVEYLVQQQVPSFHGLVELPLGQRVELHCVHPKPPSPQEALTSTPRDAELVLVGKMIKLDRYPVIVAGDLNDVAWSHTSNLFQRISRLLDPRIGRGLYNSFDAKHWFLRWPLDHVFHSDHFRLMDLQRLGYTGSDHFPIYIRLSYEPQAQQPSPPPADREDRAEAEATLEDVDADGAEDKAKARVGE